MSSEQLPEWLKFVDHTADAGIIVEAPDLVQLFERAAWRMFFVTTNVEAARGRESWHLSIDAPDLQALLVRWLSDLNYRHVTDHRVFCAFKVITLTDRHLEADAFGEAIDPSRHTVFTEIKAVTFHDLQLERDERGWVAQIIFDL